MISFGNTSQCKVMYFFLKKKWRSLFQDKILRSLCLENKARDHFFRKVLEVRDLTLTNVLTYDFVCFCEVCAPRCLYFSNCVRFAAGRTRLFDT